LRSAFLATARSGARTHIFLPATYVPGRRPGEVTGQMPKAVREAAPLPTRWARLAAGDRLWVQEEIAALIDARYNEVAQSFYKIELKGGHVPIPNGTRAGRWQTKTFDANKCTRESSRFTLEITAVRATRAHEITWEEIKREGTYQPHSTLGSWWGYQYGILMPWAENPAVLGVDFRFLDANIDTGQRWVPETKPSAPIHRIFGTPGVKD
jgi:hypothetical protein